MGPLSKSYQSRNKNLSLSPKISDQIAENHESHPLREVLLEQVQPASSVLGLSPGLPPSKAELSGQSQEDKSTVQSIQVEEGGQQASF